MKQIVFMSYNDGMKPTHGVVTSEYTHLINHLNQDERNQIIVILPDLWFRCVPVGRLSHEQNMVILVMS